MEGALLIWFAIGAGIAAGAFILVRAAVQIAGVAYAVLERRLDARVAARQTILLTLAMLLAILATGLIAAYAILAVLASLLATL